MYGGFSNSLLVGCLLKFPVMIPVIALTGGIFYSAVCDGPGAAPSAPQPEAVVFQAPVAVPMVPAIIGEKPVVVEDPKPVVVPPALPPKKKIKG